MQLLRGRSAKRSPKNYEDDAENSFLLLDERKQLIVRKVVKRWKAFKRQDRVVVPLEKEDEEDNLDLKNREAQFQAGKALPSSYFRLSLTGNDLAYKELESSAKRHDSKKGEGLRDFVGSLPKGWHPALKRSSEFVTLLDDDEFCDFDSEHGVEGHAISLPSFSSMPNLLDVNSNLYKLREARKCMRRASSNPEIKNTISYSSM